MEHFIRARKTKPGIYREHKIHMLLKRQHSVAEQYTVDVGKHDLAFLRL